MRMFFTFLASLAIVAVALPVAGCADKQLSNYICTHQIILGATASGTIRDNSGENPLIKNPVARQAALDAANVTLTAISHCDPATPQAVMLTPVAAPG